jgi:hypothetical protein
MEVQELAPAPKEYQTAAYGEKHAGSRLLSSAHVRLRILTYEASDALKGGGLKQKAPAS